MKSPSILQSIVAAVTMTFGLSTSSVQAVCPPDFDGSECVDGLDLALLLSAWNSSSSQCDLDNDGTITGADLAVLIGAWGPCGFGGVGVLNTIHLVNHSGLNPADYTVWVAGFMKFDGTATAKFRVLQSNGTFSSPHAVAHAPFINVNAGLTVHVPDVTNSGNNRLVFAVTDATAPAPSYPISGYTAYPFPVHDAPTTPPPGPYDIFEFGPNAQYDMSGVDGLGLNLSFTVAGDSYTYGVRPSVTRHEIQTAFTTFMSDSDFTPFRPLLYTSPHGAGYPNRIDDQFTAIVAPKLWLATFPDAVGLSGYWDTTVDAFFTAGNQVAFYLNAATVGHYTGVVDPTGSFITVTGTDTSPPGITVEVPKIDFNQYSGAFKNSNPFGQYVRDPSETPYHGSARLDIEYAVFSQLEANIFMAISRGVVLDGVKLQGQSITPTYTSDAWTNVHNWYRAHNNAYNHHPSVYDVYARFMHHGEVDGHTIYGQNHGQSGSGYNYPAFGMAYGFSLDENPGMGSSALLIPPPGGSGSWPNYLNVPAKKMAVVGNDAVTLRIGPWGSP